MNYDQPRQHTDGGWHYTRRNDDRIWPLGDCDQHDPHPTEDDARDCYTRYLLDHDLWLDGREGGVQRQCVAEGCEVWTDRFADIRPWGPSWTLCDTHRTREQVAVLLGRVGDSIHS